jgi:hypothetical protein
VLYECFTVVGRIIQASVPPSKRNKATKLNNHLGLKQKEPSSSGSLIGYMHLLGPIMEDSQCSLLSDWSPVRFCILLAAALAWPLFTDFYSPLDFSEKGLKDFYDIRCYAGFSMAPSHLVRRGQIIPPLIYQSPTISQPTKDCNHQSRYPDSNANP